MAVVGLLIFDLCAAVYLFLDFSSFIKNPFISGAPEKTITILPSQGLKAIAEQLEKEEIISNGLYFSLYTKLKKAGKKLQAGEYLLSASKSPEEILDMFVKGKVKLYRITLPEGLNIREIAALMEKEGRCNKEKFLALCLDPVRAFQIRVHERVASEGKRTRLFSP